jgi:hypothetical protein
VLRTEPTTRELMGLLSVNFMDKENDKNKQQINGRKSSLLLLSNQ